MSPDIAVPFIQCFRAHAARLFRPVFLGSLCAPLAFCPTFVACPLEPPDNKIERIAESISIHEGWNVPGSLVRRQHNPGALIYVGQPGAHKKDNPYAWFNSDEEGFAALIADLRAKFKLGMTLGEIMDVWSEASYGTFVSRETGISPDEVVAWASGT